MPGQPPANDEYKRRKYAPFRSTLLVSAVLKANRKPKKSLDRHPLEFWDPGDFGGSGRKGKLANRYSSMIPLFNPIMAAWVRSLAPNLERMFLTRPLTVSSVIES